MKKVKRYDISPLASPQETTQGFLKVEGHASRTGIFEYPQDDGTVRRELRLHEDVFAAKALKGYEGAPVTNNHPAKKVTAKNAKFVSVGHVQGSAKKDGDHVKVTAMITDDAGIRALRAGKRGLSTGYDVDLEEKPGVHPTYGKYDAIQRNLEINHLAIVDFPRAGSTARFRMDSAVAVRLDGMMIGGTQLTTSEDGHQHSISTLSYGGDVKTSGTTSYGMSEGSDAEHTHEWVLNDDGTITITENAGHTHVLEDGSMVESPTNSDGRNPPKRSTKMPTGKETKSDAKPAVKPAQKAAMSAEDVNIAEAAVAEAATEKARADAAETALGAMTTRAHLAEGKVAGLQQKLEEAESNRTDSEAVAAKDLAIEDLTGERDELQTKLDAAQDPKVIREKVKDRVLLERSAAKFIGEERLDTLDDKELMLAALEKCGRTDLGDKETPYIRGVFEHVVMGKDANVKALDRLRAKQRVDAEDARKRADDAGEKSSARDRYVTKQKNSWKPTPAAAAGKGN